MKTSNAAFYIFLYLGAIIPANLLVVWLGPAVTIPSAFVFIGLDLTSRDRLHEAWQRRHLFLKMAALLLTGSLLSWSINHNAGTIALASLAAFAAAGTVDALTYHALRDRSRIVKVNGSNMLSAATDSLIFPTLAFGQLMPWVVIGQFTAKVLGGFVWMYLLGLERETLKTVD
jgi:queuosine precursor transporter